MDIFQKKNPKKNKQRTVDFSSDLLKSSRRSIAFTIQSDFKIRGLLF